MATLTSAGASAAPRHHKGRVASKGTVSVLFAGSLVKYMEQSFGPSFERAYGYSFRGFGGGSTELASEVRYLNKYWVTAVFRTGGIWGISVGGEILKGVLLNYSYNMSTNVALNTFGSHQLTLGVKIFDFKKSISNSKIAN